MEVRFTLKGKNSETVFSPISTFEGDNYLLGVDENGKDLRIPIKRNPEGIFALEDISIFEETKEVIAERMLGLTEEWLENDYIGLENFFSV